MAKLIEEIFSLQPILQPTVIRSTLMVCIMLKYLLYSPFIVEYCPYSTSIKSHETAPS